VSEELVQSYFTAINVEDWDAFAPLWADDATYVTTGARQREGGATIVAYFQTLFRAWSVHHDSPEKVVITGDSATVDVHFTGTTLDGRPISFDAVDEFTFRDGRFTSGSTSYDLEHVRTMLAGETV
jgi:uncharacterized protein (TIGR02246 family)